MTKIHQRYINESIRIRETYLQTIDKISNLEVDIENYKYSIESLMEKNSDYIEKNKAKGVEQIKKDINNELLEIDTNINNITNKLEPLFKVIEKLDKDSKELFTTIKIKYPELTELDIQEQIFKSIKR